MEQVQLDVHQDTTTIVNKASTMGTCRACLMETNELRSIYKSGKICDQILKLSDMLSICTDLKYTEDDGLSTEICHKCVLHVSKAYAFRQQCHRSDEKLRENLILKFNEYKNQYLALEQNIAEGEVDGERDDDEQEVEDEEEEPQQDEEIEAVEDEQEEEEEDMEQDEDENRISSETAEEQNTDTEFGVADPNLQDENAIKIESNDYKGIDGFSETGTTYEVEILEDEQYDEAEDNLQEVVLSLQNVDETGLADPQLVYHPYRKISSADSKLVYVRKRSTPSEIASTDRKFVCEICDKVLSNASSYKYHKQLHSDLEPFLCSHCGQKFKTKNAYDGHRMTHSESNPNTCTVCGKSYRQAASLRSHMLNHSGEKPYLCGICGKGMTQKSGFKKHMLTHTGEKPHQCEFCGLYFRYSSNLIMHKRIHTGDKPYVCDICDKRFIGCEQLKRHRLTHTGEKPFACELCNKRFNRKGTLQVHMNTHNNDRKHSCKWCHKTYIQLSCLQTHMNTFHKLSMAISSGSGDEVDQ